MVKGKLLRTLHKLKDLDKQSPYVYPTARDLLLQAFTETKPLFHETEKSEAADLLKKVVPKLESSFVSLDRSLNPDLRQTAQRCRSGLEFLVDEFKENQLIFDELKPLLSSAPIKSVEKYIAYTKDISYEFVKPWPQDLTNIPKTHFWWFIDSEEDEDNKDI